MKRDITILGKVVSGKLTLKSNLVHDDVKVPLAELTKMGKPVKRLRENERGELTITPEMLVRVKHNQLLRFE